MEQQDNMLELEETFERLLEGINAIELMVYGLAHIKDPYADGLNAVYNHLRQSADEMKKILAQSVR